MLFQRKSYFILQWSILFFIGPGGCFTNISQALQNNLTKTRNVRNHIYGSLRNVSETTPRTPALSMSAAVLTIFIAMWGNSWEILMKTNILFVENIFDADICEYCDFSYRYSIKFRLLNSVEISLPFLATSPPKQEYQQYASLILDFTDIPV